MPFSRHWIMHIEACLKIRDKKNLGTTGMYDSKSWIDIGKAAQEGSKLWKSG